jgi:clan AA aspartic protease (TIGR02281 family)
LSGCTFLEASGEAVGVVGKVAWAGTKAVGGAVYTGTSMAGQTANQTNKTLTREEVRRDPASRARLKGGKTAVPLVQEGKSYYVRVKLNDKAWGKFLVDTGASALQISGAMARKLKVRPERGRTIPVSLAGGAMVAGKIVILKKVQLGDATVENVKAIVLEGDTLGLRDGLLGMSFLENFVFQIDAKRGELILDRR